MSNNVGAVNNVSAVEIPVTARPQIFNVTLNGIPYVIQLWWLVPAECWVFDFMDQSGNYLVAGVPLVTGADLLEQFKYLVPGWLWIHSDMDPDAVPDWVHLGITGHVLYRPTVPVVSS